MLAGYELACGFRVSNAKRIPGYRVCCDVAELLGELGVLEDRLDDVGGYDRDVEAGSGKNRGGSALDPAHSVSAWLGLSGLKGRPVGVDSHHLTACFCRSEGDLAVPHPRSRARTPDGKEPEEKVVA